MMNPVRTELKDHRVTRRGRPRVQLDLNRLLRLRAEGWSLRQIARACGVGKDSIRNTLKTLSKNSQDATSKMKAQTHNKKLFDETTNEVETCFTKCLLDELRMIPTRAFLALWRDLKALAKQCFSGDRRGPSITNSNITTSTQQDPLNRPEVSQGQESPPTETKISKQAGRHMR